MKTNRALFCPPNYFEIRDMKNPFMRDAGPVDKEKALEQWEALRHAFEQTEVATDVIPAVPDLEDMVFTNNQVFVGQGREGERFRFIVPSHMRFPSRQREVPYFVEWFRVRGYRVIELDYGDEYLEGHGDLLWHTDGSKVWAGYGIRSTRGGVERFAAAMRQLGITVIPLQLTEERFYHLDTCFAPLTAEAVFIYPGAFSPEALASIRAGCPRSVRWTRRRPWVSSATGSRPTDASSRHAWAQASRGRSSGRGWRPWWSRPRSSRSPGGASAASSSSTPRV